MPIVAAKHRISQWGDTRGGAVIPFINTPIELDRSHPLALGIQHCVLFQNGPVFQNYGNIAFPGKAPIGLQDRAQITSNGPGVGTVSGQTSAVQISGALSWATKPCTVICLFRVTDIASTNAAVIFEKENGVNLSDREFSLITNGDRTLKNIIYQGTTFSPSNTQYVVSGTSGGALKLGECYHFAFTVDTSNAATIYFNAVSGTATMSVAGNSGLLLSSGAWDFFHTTMPNNLAFNAAGYVIGFWTYSQALGRRYIEQHFYDPLAMMKPVFRPMRGSAATSANVPTFVPPPPRIFREGFNIYAPYV